MLHTGEGAKKSDLNELTKGKVSAHYYVDRVGREYQLVDPKYRAWHAGTSRYQGRTGFNDFSIGVETEHKKGQNWPSVQRASLTKLFKYLIELYHIEQRWVVAHRWIAPNRKFDPSDWHDNELKMWINNLYVKPTHTIPGYPTAMPCGRGFWDFYLLNGSSGMFGLALTPETRDNDTEEVECTYMVFERAIFKYRYGDGVHLALLAEARTKGWIK